MLRKAVIASLAVLIVGVSFLSFQPQSSTGVYAQGQPLLPIDVATKAATWIIHEAVPEAGGFKWVSAWGALPHIAQLYTCGIYDDGAASVGTFLLELYKHTGNSTYLDYAKGAAQWIITQAIPATGGYWWPHVDGDIPVSPGWRLSPVVRDVGEFLLEMYDATGNSTYLRYAEGAGGWMVANAESESGGYFVPYNPPGKYGSQAAHDISPGREARTITLLLHLYQTTLNDTYLQYVKGMAEWLISGFDIRTENGGYYWITGRPYHEYNDLRSDATIALFFYETYEALHNATYLNYANGAIQCLLSKTDTSDPSSYKWPDYVDLGPGGRYTLIPWVNIPDHIMDALTTGYRITQNYTYLEYAKRHVNWVLNQSITEGQGIKYPRWEGDLANGSAYENAMIYNYLTAMYAITQNSAYLDYANKTLAWIEANATSSCGGYSWIIPESANVTATLYGASGIGYYIIHTTNAYTPPTASLNYSPLSPKATETVTFNASGSFDLDGIISNYTWSFGDGVVESTTQPLVTHDFRFAGNYTVVLAVTDNESLTDTTSKTVTVEKLNSTVSLQVSLTEIELGQNVTITGAASPKAVANVTIESRIGSASWEELSTVNVESNGTYHYSWTPKDVGLYELRGRINQDQSIQASESSAVNVNVKEKPPNYIIYLGIGVVAVGILASIVYLAKNKKKDNHNGQSNS